MTPAGRRLTREQLRCSEVATPPSTVEGTAGGRAVSFATTTFLTPPAALRPDGKSVVRARCPASGCRGLVWGIYLDGGQSGVTVFGNIIGATLHGAIFDNAGGNNTHENNILLGDESSTVLMDFGALSLGNPAQSESQPGWLARVAQRSKLHQPCNQGLCSAGAAFPPGAQAQRFGLQSLLEPHGRRRQHAFLSIAAKPLAMAGPR